MAGYRRAGGLVYYFPADLSGLDGARICRNLLAS